MLLVNPPIYDFTAYDFWLRPYGMLRVAGQIKHACELSFFDFLVSKQRDAWGRGPYDCHDIPKPKAFRDIPRGFHRYGRARKEFREFLKSQFFEIALIQTLMTYWYPGVQEVIEDLREFQPGAKIILGGTYATLCPSHAQSLGADLVVEGSDLEPLWQLLSMQPRTGVPFWPQGSERAGVIKITEGCPFRCSYCSTQLIWPEFTTRPVRDCLDEFEQLAKMGVRNIAFYDDALLYRPDQALMPFLKEVIDTRTPVFFHTPNALNARFMTEELARLMVRAGFTSFFFGLESCSFPWQQATGGKVCSEEFADAVGYLRASGANSIVTYIIVGHPDSDSQHLEQSICFAHECGTRVLLSEFSPIPGTTDSKKCEEWADLKEPLSHNKTAFAIRRLGINYLNTLKGLSRRLNSQLPAS